MAELDLILVDDQEILNNIVAKVESKLDETLYPGDERRIFLEGFSYALVTMLEELNEKFNQRFAQYAKGEILDAHGMNEGCERLAKEKSWDTERFSIASALDFNVVIPKGTRVTGDNEKYFATTEVAVIMAGETFVDVKIEAVEGGEAYNGYEADKLTKLVDMVEYISKVTNLNGTTGGDNGEPYPEEDDGIGDQHYYERIRLSKNSKSTAGAEGLYEYYAKSADASISDVYVDSPSAGTIKLTIACKDGTIPSQEILKKVEEKCSSKTVRPLGDKVTVVGIEQKTYDIELCYYTTVDEESDVVKEIEGEGGAIDRFNEWQCEKNGRAINPDRLRAEILKSDTHLVGAEYVEIVKPTYLTLTGTQVAKWSGKSTITHKTSAPKVGS